MSPPLPITEDTPPDMLAGAMDLHVVLPNGQDMKMSVERSTPMMDLLVQVTTANKISPGGHVIQAIGDRGVLPYKPSTPIGALDTWTIHIVPKKKVGNMMVKKSFPKPASNTPFEQTFRLQVNLPRNQLYVSRVSYKTRLEQVLSEVCKEKNLDKPKYCFVHPDKLDEELDLSKTFLELKLQQITLVSKTNRPVGLSSVDTIALKRYENGDQHVNNKYASHSYDGSVSSGSMEGRSLSPVRSDESSSSPTILKTNSILNRPFRKRRPAPKPPSIQQNGQATKRVSDSLTISHSRNSSDSSGYHESSVLSESPESNSNSLADSLPRRSKLITENSSSSKIEQQVPHTHTNGGGKIGSSLSRSLSNLAVTSNGKSKMFLSNGIKHKEYSASSMSLASISGKKKKAPAPPPPSAISLLSLKEEDVPVNETRTKSQTLPATNKPSIEFGDESINCSEANTIVNCRLQSTTPPAPKPSPVESPAAVDVVDSASSRPKKPSVAQGAKEKELTMDDEEIDRIFHDATKDYETPPLSTLPSPPEPVINKVPAEDSYNWEYKLPSPPKAFRDQSSSPSVTEYDTVTISNLTDVINENTRRTDKADVIINNLKNTMYNQEANSPPLPKKPSTNQIVVSAIIENDPKSCTCGSDQSASASKSSNGISKVNLNCDKSPYIDVNYMSTNDSGLGSDESIPSVSEGGRIYVEEPVYAKKADTKLPSERRGSTLQNFTITTYQSSKPTEIFHDDSVKTSKTTQLAKNNHPYVKKADGKVNGLSRHSSFNTEKTPNSMVKRSKSHISLLSGNFAKFNRFGKLNVRQEEDLDETSPVHLSTENISSAVTDSPKGACPVAQSKLRKTLSEVSINKDNNRGEELLELQDQVMKWKETEKRSNTINNMNKNVSELQSVQVLKDILPQINKPQFQEKQNTVSRIPSETSHTASNIILRPTAKPKSAADSGPAVNLQSWNDRPKRQVSIKTDRDYVFGNINLRRHSDYFESMIANRNPSSESTRNEQQKCHRRESVPEDISHVPVVRAVEFKKPFVQQAKLTKSYFPLGAPKAEKEFVPETKPRPASCYLFGEHLTAGKQNRTTYQPPAAVEDVAQSQSNVTFSSSVSYNNKYKSVTEINGNSSRRSSLTNGNAKIADGYTFGTYKTRLAENEKLNGHAGYQSAKPIQIKTTGNDKMAEKKAVFKIFRKEEESVQAVTTRPVGVPPPPPVMPTLKPVSQSVNRGSRVSAEDSRDVLMFSIKNFNRDNLRKLRVN